jgi:hypothetical protein
MNKLLKNNNKIKQKNINLISQIKKYLKRLYIKYYMHKHVIIERELANTRLHEAYNNLPKSLQNILEKNEFEIYIVKTIDGNENIGGQIMYDIKLILLKNMFFEFEKNFYHECGHALDNKSKNKFISKSNEFRSIYLNEKDNFKAENNLEYYISSPAEYFASAFAEYMLNPERLRENTPRTYEFIDLQVEQMG